MDRFGVGAIAAVIGTQPSIKGRILLKASGNLAELMFPLEPVKPDASVAPVVPMLHWELARVEARWAPGWVNASVGALVAQMHRSVQVVPTRHWEPDVLMRHWALGARMRR